tara:strand:+ start:229 stop:495 length:267 start_codon:yes stop_codon:yes gene_type:complete
VGLRCILTQKRKRWPQIKRKLNRIEVIDPYQEGPLPDLPPNADLVIFEEGDESSAIILFGFKDVGMMDHEFNNPTYGISYLIEPGKSE